MFLTRIPIDLQNYDTLRALHSPERIHGMLESGFSGERDRNLWRLDVLNGQMYLLVLSPNQPDLSALQQQIGYADAPWQMKNYQPILEKTKVGTIWQFRLSANPTKSCPQGAKGNQQARERGKVEAITTVPAQREWLLRQAEKRGFLLAENGFDVTASEWKKFHKGTDQKREVTLLQVTYEGYLTVQDEEKFHAALCNGIGRGKAYGMGLLTVMSLA